MSEEMEMNDKHEGAPLFSQAVRAGKRTYFFDVKATRGDMMYLTVTESKKRFTQDGKFVFEKHKVFLYREDFNKFNDALKEAMDYICANSPEPEPRAPREYNNVNFEDLGSK